MTDLTKQLIELDKQAQTRATPTIIVTNSEGYQAYRATLEGQQRFMHRELTKWGHINLMINNTPIVTKQGVTPGYHLCDWPISEIDEINFPKAKTASEQAVSA